MSCFEDTCRVVFPSKSVEIVGSVRSQGLSLQDTQDEDVTKPDGAEKSSISSPYIRSCPVLVVEFNTQRGGEEQSPRVALMELLVTLT